jgi:hypothetical protein
VRVHQLKVDNYEQQSSRYGDVVPDDLPFMVKKVCLNFAESAFLLVGSKGVLVGEFPGTIVSMMNHMNIPLEQPASDLDIIC